MLSLPKESGGAATTTLAHETDKENDIKIKDTPGIRNKQNLITSNKRNFNTISTPTFSRVATLGEQQTPGGSSLKHPILRDITNSINTSQVHEVFFPPNGRTSLPPSIKKSFHAANNNNKPTTESKLRISEPEINQSYDKVEPPKTIEQLLALTDDQLPDIEFASLAHESAIEDDDLEGLPSLLLLDDDDGIGNVGLSIQSFELEKETESLVKVTEEEGGGVDQFPLDKHEKLTTALNSLIIDSQDFNWAYEKIQLPDDIEPAVCYMFDDLPSKIECCP